ncbi:MAG: hypothetical protein OEO82_09035, partial [Gammaproteobacteria bacterium]|nr:hypothetical protein [Gammaproteobacteria bacterium]
MATAGPVSSNAPGARSILIRVLASAITLVALVWAMDVLQQFAIYLFPAQLVVAVLGLAIAVAFVHLPANRQQPKQHTPWFDWLAAGAGLIAAGWMCMRYPQLVELTVDAPAEAVVLGV